MCAPSSEMCHNELKYQNIHSKLELHASNLLLLAGLIYSRLKVKHLCYLAALFFDKLSLDEWCEVDMVEWNSVVGLWWWFADAWKHKPNKKTEVLLFYSLNQ